MTIAIETTRLGRRYGQRWGLRDCSLRLPAGRVIGLVGPNGAGKTTLCLVDHPMHQLTRRASHHGAGGKRTGPCPVRRRTGG
jgi:ABC-type Mn2+/Zn2+ transport system ATPase subunit